MIHAIGASIPAPVAALGIALVALGVGVALERRQRASTRGVWARGVSRETRERYALRDTQGRPPAIMEGVDDGPATK